MIDVRSDELVAAVAKHLGLAGPTAIARKLELSYSGPERVRRWLKGDNEPDFASTIALLDAAGWINEKELLAALAALRAEGAAAAATTLGETARRAASRQRSRRGRETG